MRKVLEKDAEQIRKLAEEQFSGKEVKEIERLGGMTNHTYAVRLEEEKYVFRLPGEGTEHLINRKNEKTSTVLASDLGVDTRLLYFNADTGVKITKYIDGAVTMMADMMKERENIDKIAKNLRHLHNCGQDTKVAFEVFEMIAEYESVLQKYSVAFYEDYEEIRQKVMKLKQRVDKIPFKKTPCHNDPLCENWIFGEERLYLIDWEYAGMNDPMWDLADVSVEADYDEGTDTLLLKTYFEKEPTEDEKLRFYANKVYLDFLWSLWGKARVPFDGEALEEYARERYVRMKKNLANIPV